MTINKLDVRIIVVMFLFSYVISDYVRTFLISSFIHSENLQNVNFIFIFFLFFLVLKKILSKQYNYVEFFLWIPCFLFTAISLIFSSSKTDLFIASVFYLLPLLLLGIKVNREELKIIFSKCLTLLNTIVFILLILGVFDYITKGDVQLFFIRHNYFNQRITELIFYERAGGLYRYYSFFGHPLRTSQLFLTFFILNSIFNKYFYTKLNPFVVSIITLLGVTLSNSKTGVLLALILVMFFGTVKSKKIKVFYHLLIVLALAFLITSHFFKSTVMERLTNEQGHLSNGRFELVQNILDGNIERPVFVGGGLNHSIDVKNTSNSGATSFEFPILMFSYDLGIGATFFMFIILFIYPAIRLILHRNYYLLGLLMILSLDVNSYNGLINIGDFMIQFSFVVFLLLNVNTYITEVYNKRFYAIRWNKPDNSRRLITR